MLSRNPPKSNWSSHPFTQEGAVFLPIAINDGDATPGEVLDWIRSFPPQHDGSLYVRISDVRAKFGTPDLFYRVVMALFRQGMVAVERWRLETLGPQGSKPAWQQFELLYVITPLDLGRDISFECYTRQEDKPKPFSKEERLEIWKAHGGVCVYCQSPVSVEDMAVDHDLPKSRRGSNDRSNLRCSCHPCNNDKHARTGEEYRRLLAERAAQ